MSLNALFTGSSALSANAQVLDVVGNNLANLNTVGFKGQRVEFKDLLYQSVQSGTALSGNVGSTNPQQVGFGVQTGAIDTMFEQGSSSATGRDLDVSISGHGFFVVNDGTRNLYTRAGSFTVDSSGFLTDANTGFRVQRFGTSGEGSTGVPAFQTPGDLRIRVPFGSTAPGLQTGNVTFAGNLSAASAPGDTAVANAQIYDSQSTPRALALTFTRAAAANTYTLSASIGSGTVTFPSGNTITFDNQGLIKSPSTIQISITGIPQATSPAQTVTLNFGTVGQSDGITQFGSPSSLSAPTQDGSGAGQLSTVNIDQSGVMQGVFTNGRVIPLAQLGIATFANVGGLSREGNNDFEVTSASGDAQIGAAGTGGRGLASRGTLEGSNVDISIEFSRLIIAQRGFQVNTKTITAADQILQDLTNIIR